jgi:hypothetical protein
MRRGMRLCTSSLVMLIVIWSCDEPAAVPLRSAQLQPVDWDRADAATVRLAPAVFTELPAALRAELTKRGCTIPQPFRASARRNVVSGRFTTGAQKDWAVLCSRGRSSAILVFRDGSATNVGELAEDADRQYLQVMDGRGAIGYSRVLSVVTPQRMRQRRLVHDGPDPRPFDHDGIEDAFEGKASVVWYWFRRDWIRLTGAD